MADVLKNLFKIILGLVLIVLPIWFAVLFPGWGQAAVDLIQGGIVIAIILIGLVLLVLGFSELKE